MDRLRRSNHSNANFSHHLFKGSLSERQFSDANHKVSSLSAYFASA